MKTTRAESGARGDTGNRVETTSLLDAVSGARPRLIARRRHLIAILSAVVCITFCLLFLWMMHAQVPHARAWGEHLNLAALATNEHVIVRHDHGTGREPQVFQYRIGWHDDPHGIVCARFVDPWKDESVVDVLATGTLNNAQAEGLEALVACFRSVREERSSDPGFYDLVYYRNGRKIGEEHFVGFSLAEELTRLRRFGPDGDRDVAYELGRLARQYDVPRDQLDRMVTFDMLCDQLTQTPHERAER